MWFKPQHDDVTKRKHIPRFWPFVLGIDWSPVNSSHNGQWRGALMLSLICTLPNGCVNNRHAGDLRRNREHYDATVMKIWVYFEATCGKKTCIATCGKIERNEIAIKQLKTRIVCMVLNKVQSRNNAVDFLKKGTIDTLQWKRDIGCVLWANVWFKVLSVSSWGGRSHEPDGFYKERVGITTSIAPNAQLMHSRLRSCFTHARWGEAGLHIIGDAKVRRD